MRAVLILVFFLCISAERAWAYLDSGSASMVIQLAAAAIMGSLVFMKLNWQKLKQLVKKAFHRK